MSHSQKKSYKTNYSKGKAFEADRWDHGGYEQMQKELDNTSYAEDNSIKFRRSSKFNQDSTLASDNVEPSRSENIANDINKKWTHDKYQETANILLETKIESTPKEDNIKSKKEKKPDMPLYSVRRKQNKYDELSNTNTLSTPRSGKFDDFTPRAKNLKDISLIDDKDTTPFEDDKSFISNVSTAISDRRNLEEDLMNCKEGKLDILHERGTAEKLLNIRKDDSHFLFELTVDNERQGEVIKVYDNEEDYETFLENVCTNLGIKNELALYFKIHVLQLVLDSHPDPKRVEPLFNRLLDINYKLMMLEFSKSSLDDPILDFADNDSSQSVRENSN